MAIHYGRNRGRSSVIGRVLAGLLMGLVFGVVGLGAQVENQAVPSLVTQIRERLTQTTGGSAQERSFALAALDLVGRTELRVNGRTYPYDCSGTVMAALSLSGADLYTAYAFAPGTGVNRLHELAARQNLLYDLPLPQIGDLVFWDNTWDANDDKLWNDDLTHIGIVVWIEPNGTVYYVHEDYARGIVVAQMNLLAPGQQFAETTDGSKVEINSAMRMRSQEYLRPGVTLSGQLFRDFGRIYDYNNSLKGSAALVNQADTSK